MSYDEINEYESAKKKFLAQHNINTVGDSMKLLDMSAITWDYQLSQEYSFLLEGPNENLTEQLLQNTMKYETALNSLANYIFDFYKKIDYSTQLEFIDQLLRINNGESFSTPFFKKQQGDFTRNLSKQYVFFENVIATTIDNKYEILLFLYYLKHLTIEKNTTNLKTGFDVLYYLKTSNQFKYFGTDTNLCASERKHKELTQKCESLRIESRKLLQKVSNSIDTFTNLYNTISEKAKMEKECPVVVVTFEEWFNELVKTVTLLKHDKKGAVVDRQVFTFRVKRSMKTNSFFTVKDKKFRLKIFMGDYAYDDRDGCVVLKCLNEKYDNNTRKVIMHPSGESLSFNKSGKDDVVFKGMGVNGGDFVLKFFEADEFKSFTFGQKSRLNSEFIPPDTQFANMRNQDKTEIEKRRIEMITALQNLKKCNEDIQTMEQDIKKERKKISELSVIENHVGTLNDLRQVLRMKKMPLTKWKLKNCGDNLLFMSENVAPVIYNLFRECGCETNFVLGSGDQITLVKTDNEEELSNLSMCQIPELDGKTLFVTKYHQLFENIIQNDEEFLSKFIFNHLTNGVRVNVFNVIAASPSRQLPGNGVVLVPFKVDDGTDTKQLFLMGKFPDKSHNNPNPFCVTCYQNSYIKGAKYGLIIIKVSRV
ncbi:hypothetical protein EIN_016310 [Entamoeba invadens IP1]|uniref:hypothetical protein n=1 Tax=Entamoeba invadens IP1 TaxID=370355 RepID=UPI0002C3DBE2|nr:hypothetical protein EIN_016310 [Entamoeba invadens IP1]ELP90412.1 hypothetical protein EIN_016310 [Entamoeba invadens IP1]|eukprot:XP_004257183.1 hypothetical protein EIN_016310 [Entamoeba invadens IP1]